MQRGGVDVPRAEGAPGGGPLRQQAVVRPAQQLVVPQRELVPGQEVSAANRAPKTLHVVHVVPSPHHQLAAAESHVALCAFDAKQPERSPETDRFYANGPTRSVNQTHVVAPAS